MSQQGPRLKLVASCLACDFCRSEKYRVQGDSGHDVFCEHALVKGRRIGDSTWNTPDWCPLRVAALDAFLAEVKS